MNAMSTYLDSAQQKSVPICHVARPAVAHHRVARAELRAQRILDAVLNSLLKQKFPVGDPVPHLVIIGIDANVSRSYHI